LNGRTIPRDEDDAEIAPASDATVRHGALRLDMAVKFLKGVGERRAEQLERLGIRTARDLLWHLPHRYIDASSVTPLARAEIGQEVACVGRVVAKGVVPTRRGLRIFHAVLRDDSGCWNASGRGRRFLDRSIAVGQTLLVERARSASTTAASWRRASTSCSRTARARTRWRPDGFCRCIPATEGLSHKIHPLAHRSASRRAHRPRRGPVPPAIRAEAGLMPLAEALRSVHRPEYAVQAEAGRRRLAFDELLDLQLMLIRARAVAKRQRSGVAFTLRRDLTSRLKAALPWELTGDQQRALREITGDMTAPDRMHRLLMGDVGTGKTVVGPVRHAAGGGERLPGRPHGSDRAAGGAARGDPDAPAGAARAPAGAAPGPAVGEPRRRRSRPLADGAARWWSARTR
jgi:ATP-dependent DNA helicase RecG